MTDVRALWPALVVLLVSLAATLGVSLRIRSEIQATAHARFLSAADRLQESILSRISTYIAMLEAGSGLVAASQRLTQDEFFRFVERLQLPVRYPGIQGIGYTVRLAPHEVGPFVQQQRRAGRPGFHVWPEEARSEYHTIVYLEPLDFRNRRAIGYDMATDPTRRAAMERARDTGRAAASGRVRLVQEVDGTDEQPGFLIYVPVYAGGDVPATIEERRQQLVGFIYSPFRARDLFAGIFGGDPQPRAGVELFDLEPHPDHLLMATSAPDRQDAGVALQRPLTVAGRRWTAVFFSTPPPHPAPAVLTPIVFGTGVGLSLFLAGLTLLQIRARQRVERSEAIIGEASERFRQQAETLEQANRRISELLEREHAARAEAERAGREKDEFLATLSHELRTPLAAVVGWSDLLAAGLPADQASRALTAVRRNARAQLQLVNDLLDMSRIAGGRMQLELHDIDPRDVVEAAVTVTRPAAEAKRVRIETEATPDLPLIRADPARLQQVVWNLLTNAIKFTPSDGSIRIRLASGQDDVVLTVTDTGTGIDPAFLPHVFDRFRQADASPTRRAGGLGLGLSIVRHIVEMHGGTVDAHSEGAGRGATFAVRLPRTAPGAAPAPPARPGQRPEPLPPPLSPQLLAGVRILAVDDEPDAREMIHTALARHGADVTALASPVEALAFVENGTTDVDIIISDLSMPEMDGLELMRRVRQLPIRNGRPGAVALTAYARPEDQSRAILAGFDVHLPKPFEIPALVTTCAALAERVRQGR